MHIIMSLSNYCTLLATLIQNIFKEFRKIKYTFAVLNSGYKKWLWALGVPNISVR